MRAESVVAHCNPSAKTEATNIRFHTPEGRGCIGSSSSQPYSTREKRIKGNVPLSGRERTEETPRFKKPGLEPAVMRQ